MPSWRFSNFKKVVFSNFKVGAIELIWKIPGILANRLNGPAYRYSTARPPIWPKANDQIPSSRARRPKLTAPHVLAGSRRPMCWPYLLVPLELEKSSFASSLSLTLFHISLLLCAPLHRYAVVEPPDQVTPKKLLVCPWVSVDRCCTRGPNRCTARRV
jgi:hypothetical protein